MAIEKEVYEEILNKAVKDAQERFPQRFMRYDYDKNKGWTELGTVTINEFIDDVYKNYEDNHLMEGDSIMSKEARQTSFAANRALQIMYGVAASEDIKRNINDFFDDKKIVASMLDGDEVTCRANNSVNYMHVNPMIKDKTVETWWDMFIEKLAEIFYFSTDRKWVAEKRESFEKAKEKEVDTTRQRVSFEEIKESSPFDKVTASSKKQKTKEMKNLEL